MQRMGLALFVLVGISAFFSVNHANSDTGERNFKSSMWFGTCGLKVTGTGAQTVFTATGNSRTQFTGGHIPQAGEAIVPQDLTQTNPFAGGKVIETLHIEFGTNAANEVVPVRYYIDRNYVRAGLSDQRIQTNCTDLK